MDRTERTIKWRSLPNVSNGASEPHTPLPAVCDVSVTNVCNAACDFCGFSREKKMAGPRRYLDPDAFARAMPMLRRRKIRYMTLQGGEPLVHPQIESLVGSATKAGIQCGVITNGWFLPRHIKQLAAAGLKRLLISIDSADMSEHERNRGLPGLAARIHEGIAEAHAFGIPVCATVTVSHLVRYAALPETLDRLGFDSVVFSYPRRDAFGSTSLVYDEHSKLVDLSRDELLEALSAIERLKKRFRVMDPGAALDEVARFVRGEQQRIPCIAGSKYFYIDWNLDIWRCEPWDEPMGSVFDLDHLPDQQEPCNACMMGCYRHASVLMHGAKAVTDSAYALGRGELRSAVSLLFQRGVAYSLWALATEELPRTALGALGGRSGARRSSPQGA
ncbi:radical SAM protein [Paraburkholderia heleia]|uniref:radical SAM protein n=1 Tax=Paraburkholderia heleia TaxID=634127 RepID=UPI002AB7A05A|nr:radical SAM protein [Paraburkholderia heleia]